MPRFFIIHTSSTFCFKKLASIENFLDKSNSTNTLLVSCFLTSHWIEDSSYTSSLKLLHHAYIFSVIPKIMWVTDLDFLCDFMCERASACGEWTYSEILEITCFSWQPFFCSQHKLWIHLVLATEFRFWCPPHLFNLTWHNIHFLLSVMIDEGQPGRDEGSLGDVI